MQHLGEAYAKRAEATAAKAKAKANTKAKRKGKVGGSNATTRRPAAQVKGCKTHVKKVTMAAAAPKQVPTYNIEWCRNRVVCRFGPEGSAPAFSFKHGDASSTNKAKAAGRKWVLAACKQLKCDPPTKVLA